MRISLQGFTKPFSRGNPMSWWEDTRCHPERMSPRAKRGGGTQRMPPPPRASGPRGDNPERPSVALGERERHVAATAGRVVLPAPAGDYDELAPVHHVGGRR